MSKSSTLFVAMNVHKDSIGIALAEALRDGEIRQIGELPVNALSPACLLVDPCIEPSHTSC